MQSKNKIETIQSLRGIASLTVAWFHLTDRVAYAPLKFSGMYGGHGINVFFVISGFIIPYALHRRGYRMKDVGRFFLKRVIRLEPPYLVSILIVLALHFSTVIPPWLRGEPHDPFIRSVGDLALHIGYLNGYFGRPWLNVVYWTLAVESQYYLLIGLLFPLLASKRVWLRTLTFVALAALSLLGASKYFIGSHIFLFLMGVLTWKFRAGLVRHSIYIAGMILLLLGAYLKRGADTALAGLVAVSVIMLGDAIKFLKGRVLLFLGDISYSLYLVHFSIGIHFINVYRTKFFTNGPLSPAGEMIMVLLALAVSIIGAYLLFKLVEEPARRAASAIAYSVRRGQVSAARP